MGSHTRLLLPLLLLGLLGACRTPASEAEPGEKGVAPLVTALEHEGRPPLDFVLDRLAEVDLVLFDDALHSAVEPFEFYSELVRAPGFRRLAPTVFLEVVGIDQQPALDDFLASEDGDPARLLPAFRNDVSGTGGIGYRTYLDLLETIRSTNHASPPDERVRVVAVSNPCYWPAIRSARDVEIFRRSLAGRDYDMYRWILEELDGFRSGRKGVFLTNTRHAYTGVRRAEGGFFWNTGTFFRQWHPGRSVSIRIHGPCLRIQRLAPEGSPATAQGLERFEYRWARVDGGRWDRAFAARGDRPVAIDLAGTPFGRAPYLGNHGLGCAPDSTMADAYDAVLFLAPLERQRQAAAMPGLYGDDFRPELERRYALLHTPEEIREACARAGVATLAELVAHELVEWAEEPAPRPE